MSEALATGVPSKTLLYTTYSSKILAHQLNDKKDSVSL